MPSLLVVAKTINDNLIQKYISFSDYLCHVSCLSVLCICGTKLKLVDIAILSLKWWKNYLSFYQGFRSALRAVFKLLEIGLQYRKFVNFTGTWLWWREAWNFARLFICHFNIDQKGALMLVLWNRIDQVLHVTKFWQAEGCVTGSKTASRADHSPNKIEGRCVCCTGTSTHNCKIFLTMAWLQIFR